MSEVERGKGSLREAAVWRGLGLGRRAGSLRRQSRRRSLRAITLRQTASSLSAESPGSRSRHRHEPICTLTGLPTRRREVARVGPVGDLHDGIDPRRSPGRSTCAVSSSGRRLVNTVTVTCRLLENFRVICVPFPGNPAGRVSGDSRAQQEPHVAADRVALDGVYCHRWPKCIRFETCHGSARPIGRLLLRTAACRFELFDFPLFALSVVRLLSSELWHGCV